MNITLKHYVKFKLLIIFFSISVFAQNTNTEKMPILIEHQVILNQAKTSGKSGIQNRYIYILIKEKNFSENLLKELFFFYEKEFPEPYRLFITVYTNEEMLQRLINFNKQSIFIDFTGDEKGRKAQQEFYQQYYPLPKGYFRADYNRYGDFYYFDYSPEKDSVEMKRVVLENSTKGNIK